MAHAARLDPNGHLVSSENGPQAPRTTFVHEVSVPTGFDELNSFAGRWS